MTGKFAKPLASHTNSPMPQHHKRFVLEKRLLLKIKNCKALWHTSENRSFRVRWKFLEFLRVVPIGVPQRKKTSLLASKSLRSTSYIIQIGVTQGKKTSLLVINKTKNKVICDKAFVYSGLLKYLGLIFSPPLKKHRGVLLEISARDKPNLGIHMLFVFYKISAIWLNEKNKVVKIAKAYPFISILSCSGQSNKILEGPTSIIDRKLVSVGDQLELLENK